MDASEIYWSEYYNLTEVSMYMFCKQERCHIIFTVICEKMPPNVR